MKTRWRVIWKNSRDWLMPIMAGLVILVAWQVISPMVPGYILPSPLAIGQAFLEQLPILLSHVRTTGGAALVGIAVSIVLAFVTAIIMDLYPPVYRMLYPLALISQTVPLIAVAPLFILWFGFGFVPKLLAVILVCYFPILVNLLGSFRELDRDYVRLLGSMGAGPAAAYLHVKIPGTLPSFFAGLRIAATYSIMGAVIGEWLGGSSGLGVYLIRSQKSFAASRVFAAILMIVLMSFAFFLAVRIAEYIFLPWQRKRLPAFEGDANISNTQQEI